MTSKSNCNLFSFLWVFRYSRPRNINLRPEFYHENDRKSEADLLKYKFYKVRIFDQKIIEEAITINYDIVLSVLNRKINLTDLRVILLDWI